MPVKICMWFTLFAALCLYQGGRCVNAQEPPKPIIPVITNGLRYDHPIKKSTPGVSILPRELGVFEPLLSVFQQELHDEYAWCGASKSGPFKGFPCNRFYHVGSPLKLSDRLFVVAVDFLGSIQLGNNFRHIAMYGFHPLLSDGFVFLDHIAVYDMSDDYMQRVVSLPESNALQSELATRGLTAKLYQANRADEWVEMYLVVYPKTGIIKGYEGWRPPLKASLLMQAFYPREIEKEFKQLFIPILNENLWAYANALKE